MEQDENKNENGDRGFPGGREDGVAGTSREVSQTDADASGADTAGQDIEEPSRFFSCLKSDDSRQNEELEWYRRHVREIVTPIGSGLPLPEGSDNSPEPGAGTAQSGSANPATGNPQKIPDAQASVPGTAPAAAGPSGRSGTGPAGSPGPGIPANTGNGPVTGGSPAKKKPQRVRRKTELWNHTIEPAWREEFRKRAEEQGSERGRTSAKKSNEPCTLSVKHPPCREVLAKISDLQHQIEELDAEIADMKAERGSA